MANSQALWEDVRDYCNERLKEIKDINTHHQCPSAVVCIATFLGYLSRLAFGTNLASDHRDGQWFRDFIKSFMSPKYHAHADLIYSTFRCGLVHAMSFDDAIPNDPGNRAVYLEQQGGMTSGYSKLAITHDHAWDRLCTGQTLQPFQDTHMYVLVAGVLCDDIVIAIDNMFRDVGVRRNCEEYVKCQRRIQCIDRSSVSASTNQSGPIVIGLNTYGLMTNAPSLSSSI